MNLRTRLFLVFTTLVAALLVAVGAAGAAVPSLTPGRTIPMGYTATTHYTLAPDGTLWVVRETGSDQGKVWHLDNAGGTLAEYSISRGYFYPLGIAYYGGRVYVSTATSLFAQLLSWPAGEIGIATPAAAEAETGRRLGSLGFYIRAGESGNILGPLGQANKIAVLNGNAVTGAHPYYPQTVMGAGINSGYNPLGTPFEICYGSEVAPGGTPPNCGGEDGYTPAQKGAGFGYPDDIAEAPGGLYVLDAEGDVAFVDTTGTPTITNRFGNTGPDALKEPFSIVRDPAGGNLYVTDQGNRRIDVFSAAGAFLAAFGYGVRDGADAFQSCGPEIAECHAAVSYSTDPRSYFSRLDLGADGSLYAYQPLAEGGRIQVFSPSEAAGVGGGGETPGGGGGGGGETPGTGGGGGAGGGSTGGGSGGSGSTGTGTPKPTPPTPTKPKCAKPKKLKKVAGKLKCVKPKKHKHHHKAAPRKGAHH
jgi:DNA-binding beta-propeller fold protein YncE